MKAMQNAGQSLWLDNITRKLLAAFEDHGRIGRMLPGGGGNAERELSEFIGAGIDVDATAEELQQEGAEAFAKSWEDLVSCIEGKTTEFRKAG